MKDWYKSNKKRVIPLAVVLILVITLPLTLILVNRAQDYRSTAASPDKLEAEAGVLDGAVKRSDSLASGGKYIKFVNIATTPTNSPTSSPIGSCNVTISTSVNKIDGRGSYSNIKPGNVVCLKSGSRGNLVIQNVKGSSSAPIIFINSGGQVNAKTITVYNSQFIRITGTGESGIKYGIKTNSGGATGVKLLKKTDNYEVDNIEITNAGIGFNTKTFSTCLDGSYNDWDYDGDGKINGDLGDMVDQSNYTQKNMEIHDNFIHDVSKEGLYLGPNDTTKMPRNLNNCSLKNSRNVLMENLHVYNNILQDWGRDGFNPKGARIGCQLHHNTVIRGSYLKDLGQQGGFSVNSDSSCDIYNNLIIDGDGNGIRDNGIGGNTIYNNIIIRPGQAFLSTEPKASGIYLFGGNANKTTNVYNNTIVGAKSWGIKTTRSSNVRNNIVVSSGNSDISITGTNNTNLTGGTSNAKFVNPGNDNYHLQSTSPAKDSGVNLSSEGITKDFDDTKRPQGSKFDIGAYEFK